MPFCGRFPIGGEIDNFGIRGEVDNRGIRGEIADALTLLRRVFEGARSLRFDFALLLSYLRLVVWEPKVYNIFIGGNFIELSR